jgi:hypothetical protein
MYEPVDTLELLEVREYVPVAYRVTLSAQIFRVVGRSLKDYQGTTIFPKESDILTSGDLTVNLEDTLTGNVTASFQNVKCSEHSWDVTSRGIVSENVSFIAIRVVDEVEIPIG